MRLSEICIRRPVLSWVMTLLLILVGLVGGSRLALQQYPTIERPYLTIEASLSGAAPEIVEAQVTRIIEDAIAGIEGVVSVSSTSSTEDSKVIIEGSSSRNTDNLSNDVIAALRKVKDRFPQDMPDPTLTKSRADDRPILTIALTSDVLDASELADYALRDLKNDLESVSGVARVDVLGASLYKMRLKLDPVKLSEYKMTVAEVMQAIRQQNIEKPAGKLRSEDREYLVTTVANLETPEEFDRLPIATRDGHLIHLRDIGKAEVSADDKRTRTRFNGKTGVSISIVKQSIANPIEVARTIKKMLPTIEERLSDKMTLHLGSDKTLFIEKSISQVYWAILEATLLVIMVVVIFLRSFRASIIPLVTIPVSLIGALFVMYVLNFSINTLTLMSMVLAIGLVVDDAIVVLENIYRHIEDGLKPLAASLKGIREISFSIIAMTLTLAAVYAPIALSTGTIGKFFTEFALTLSAAVIISGFAALTLSPMMCARMLRHSPDEANFVIQDTDTMGAKIFKKIRSEKWLIAIEDFYDQVLREMLHKPWQTILAGAVFALIGYVCFLGLPRELFPKEDQGAIFIDGQATQSATLEYTDRYVKQLDDLLATYPEIKRRVTNINNPTYDISIQLNEDRTRPTSYIEDDLRTRLREITGIESKIDAGSSGGAERSNMVEFVVQTNKTYGELKGIAESMTRALYASDFVEAVFSNTHPDTEDFTVSINRSKASSLSIEPLLIADTIDTLIRGRKSTTFKKDNKVFDVMVEVMDQARQTPRDITNLFIKAGDKAGTLVPISELITVTSRAGPMEIYRYNRMRAVSYTIKLKQSAGGLGVGVESVKALAKDVLPENSRIDFTGETKRFLSESQNILLVFALALAFIYLIMAAQFESWVDPFIIILSVPLSLAGAAITLVLINGGTLNIYSQIGFVTLIGLITKHGIMMVDFANRLRDEGELKNEAIIMASKMRLRPILMTTLAMVLGALPLAFGGGSGAESRRQIGWVIVGGMSMGTLFTLFVLPSFYIYLSRYREYKIDAPDSTAAV